MNPFHASLLFRSLSIHFTQKQYDYFRYRGNVTGGTIAAEKRFNASKTLYLFAHLSEHPDPEGFIVSNLIKNPKTYITDIISASGLETYRKWDGFRSALYYNFDQELEKFDKPGDLVRNTPSSLPLVLDLYIRGEISPDTVIIIESVIRRFKEWETLPHPLIAQNIMKLNKYAGFVTIKPDKIREIFERKYT